MRCNCEDGLRCSTVSVCYMEQELADKQEDVDSVRAENAALAARLADVSGERDLILIRAENAETALGQVEARLAELEIAKVALEVFNGVACDAEQAEGNGPCGICVKCLRSRLADWHKVADERSAEIVRLSAQLAEVDSALGAWGRNEAGDSATIIRIAKAVGAMDTALKGITPDRENECE